MQPHPSGFRRLPGSALPAKALRGLHRYAFRVLGERLYLRNVESGPAVLAFRVDDFPRWDRHHAQFEVFHGVMRDARIPYLLGVTPFLDFHGRGERMLTEDEVAVLRRVVDEGVELALHGFTHRYRIGGMGVPDETSFYRDTELEGMILRALEWFEAVGLPAPKHYIPPFNALSLRDFEMVSRWMPFVHGGPISISTLGPFATSAVRDAVYFPSYEPFYNRASRIRSELCARLPRRGGHWVTLHWAWEADDANASLAALARWLRMESQIAVVSPSMMIERLGRSARDE